ALILADEPTGNLDPGTAAKVMEALVHQSREHGSALVLVTHSLAATEQADRVLHLRSEGMTDARG
ncbi:MAG: ABC transporter ATP-binding protein, partial [Betaproteobacteria bacterium]|nr:ABC transporter ATP-binding protein [Betaproteobacteria bacterium]